MGLLTDFLKKFGPLKANDPLFGPLLYMKMPKGRISYWEAKREFPPNGREIELFIDAPAPETPPNELQRHFFGTVSDRYNEIMAAADSLLRPRFEELMREPMNKEFSEEFLLTSFSIPNSSLESANWEVSFESSSDPDHLFSITFQGLSAKQVAIDG